MTRITVLISGRGSNLAALIDAARAGELIGGTIVRVISNRPGAAGLACAAEAGIATAVVDHRQFPSREAFDAALREAIDADRPDLVVLAGFMRVLGAAFVRHYEGRMLNIHPSLLPAFPGLDTHRRALDAGASMHGCSVHFVSADVDGGPVVAQAAVPVLAGDDAERLAERVLVQEHRLLPEVVRWFCAGRLMLADGTAYLDRAPLASPRVLAAAAATEPNASPAAAPSAGGPRRVRGVFWLALAASVAVHLLWSLWPTPVPRATTEPVLTATIETMPPPPTASAAPRASAPTSPPRPQAAAREAMRRPAARPAVTEARGICSRLRHREASPRSRACRRTPKSPMPEARRPPNAAGLRAAARHLVQVPALTPPRATVDRPPAAKRSACRRASTSHTACSSAHAAS